MSTLALITSLLILMHATNQDGWVAKPKHYYYPTRTAAVFITSRGLQGTAAPKASSLSPPPMFHVTDELIDVVRCHELSAPQQLGNNTIIYHHLPCFNNWYRLPLMHNALELPDLGAQEIELLACFISPVWRCCFYWFNIKLSKPALYWCCDISALHYFLMMTWWLFMIKKLLCCLFVVVKTGGRKCWITTFGRCD